MKPERKEQLEVNDLEVFLRIKLPKLWKKHGNTVLLLLLLICAAIAFWNIRRGQMKKLDSLAQNNLAIGWDSLRELQIRFHALDMTDDAITARLQLTRETLDRFDTILSTNPKPYAKAWAMLGKGEVYWLLANAPAEAMATTQLVIGPTTQSSEEYLSMAESAYKQVLADHADQHRAVITSLFALAAIEENRGAFDEAAVWYDKVIDSSYATQADQAFARRRKSMLDDYKHPLLIKGLLSTTTQPGL